MLISGNLLAHANVLIFFSVLVLSKRLVKRAGIFFQVGGDIRKSFNLKLYGDNFAALDTNNVKMINPNAITVEKFTTKSKSMFFKQDKV